MRERAASAAGAAARAAAGPGGPKAEPPVAPPRGPRRSLPRGRAAARAVVEAHGRASGAGGPGQRRGPGSAPFRGQERRRTRGAELPGPCRAAPRRAEAGSIPCAAPPLGPRAARPCLDVCSAPPGASSQEGTGCRQRGVVLRHLCGWRASPRACRGFARPEGSQLPAWTGNTGKVCWPFPVAPLICDWANTLIFFSSLPRSHSLDRFLADVLPVAFRALG